jgi:hypothetical protein
MSRNEGFAIDKGSPRLGPRCILAIALVLSTVAYAAPAGMSAAAAVHFDRGMAAFGERRYQEAASAFEEGFAVEPRRELLFAWAQAERLAGRCAAAVPLYERYLATQPAAPQVEAARIAMARCPPVVRAPVEPEPPVRAQPAVAAAEVVAPTEPRPPMPRRRLSKGAWVGISLAAVAVVGTAVGLGVGLSSPAPASRGLPTVDFRGP